MSVRPRRTFAPAFVVTVAGTAALAVADDKPAPDKPPVIHRNPPPPKQPPPKEPPKTARHWSFYQQGKDCYAADRDACPPQPAGKPVPSCNPPPPKKIACEANLSLPVNVVQRANELECWVEHGNMTCPPNMSCNPPPPRKVTCPD